MKNTIFLFTLIISICFTSCQNDFSEINKNPNNVSETHPQLLLTKIASDAFRVKGTSAMYATRMIVATDGENSNQNYKWSRNNFNSYNSLRQVSKMIQESNRIKSNTYIAIAKFFRAFYFYNLTLTFGDIPYKQALKGEDDAIYTPKYDSQKDVFTGILKELSKANDLLKNNHEIVKGDIIYGGNTLKWRKLINSFRLKILLSLSKKEGTSNLNIKNQFYSIATSEPIIQSLENNGQLVFLDQEGSRYTEFNSSGYGSGMYMCSTFINALKKRKDPRLFIFSGQTKKAKEEGLAIDNFNAYNGGNPIVPYGEVNKEAAKGLLSKVNLRYSTNPTTEPHNILSYWEVEFILAEAAVRGWIPSNAKTHYENGIKASFQFYRNYAKKYENYVNEAKTAEYLKNNFVNFDNANSQNKKIEFIATQKYFSSFLQGGWDNYFNYLRTEYPYFPTVTGVTAPKRWIYPESEYNNNRLNVSKAIESQFGTGNDKINQTTWWLK